MPASDAPDRPHHRTLPLWPFVTVLPPLLLLGVFGTMWLPEIQERAACNHLSRLPGITIQRGQVQPLYWPWIPVNRFTDWLHLLHPPHAPAIWVKIGPDFPLEELERLNSIRLIDRLDAAGSKLVDSDLARLRPRAMCDMLVLDDTAISDAGLVHLRRHPGLCSVSLRNTRVTDAGVPSLAGKSYLVRLDLTGTAVTGRGFSSLSRLSHLKTLSLGRTRVDDAGLAEIVRCPNVRSLDLYATRVTDAGMPSLAGLKHLESLSLDRTSVGDAGLAAYQASLAHPWPWRRVSLRHTRITGPGLMSTHIETSVLHLSGTTVGDEAAAWLATRKFMRELELNGTRFTDTGLDELAKSLNLVSVWLKGCPVTEAAAIRFLVSALPGPGKTGTHAFGHGPMAEQTFVPGIGTLDATGQARPASPYPPEIVRALFEFHGTGRLNR
jgi:hypothetical protein